MVVLASTVVLVHRVMMSSHLVLATSACVEPA